MGGGGNSSRCVPEEVELWLLWDWVALFIHFFFRGRLIFTLDLRLLLEGALKSVTVLEVPGASSFWFVVIELALEVKAVRVDPLSSCELTISPFTSHFHAGLFEHNGAVATLLSILPPAGIDITIIVGEDSFAVATTVLPVAVIFTLTTIVHLANTLPFVLHPAAFIAVASLGVSVDTSALSDSINEVTFIDVVVLIGGSSLTSEATRRGLLFIVLSA